METDNITKVKMFLFARWISMCYADDQIDLQKRLISDPDCDSENLFSVLNVEDGYWWKKRIRTF